MCLKLVLLISIVWILSVSRVSGAAVELGYYWLDYNGGTMSPNALILDPTRNEDYIGQAFTKEYELLPAIIHTSQPYASFNAYYKDLTNNKHIKVLCSQFLGYFKWIPTNTTTYRSVPDKVPAGTEAGREVFFGKYVKNGKLTLGKVWNGLVSNTVGTEKNNDDFQVLVYRIGD